MRITSFAKMPAKHRLRLVRAKRAASRSVDPRGHRVGCLIACAGGEEFLGATASRTRAIGSTCAERMALDQWYFDRSHPAPVVCYLVGNFMRESWKKHFVCTPCGTCLEMFLELFVDQNLDKLKFICGSWDLKRVLVADLDELFPQFGKGGWPYETKGVR